MLKKRHAEKLEKTSKSLLKYLGLSFFFGTFLNVQIKRVYINFLRFPAIVRIPLRFGIMALPFLATGGILQ